MIAGTCRGQAYLVSNPAGKLFAFIAFVIDHVDRTRDAGRELKFWANL
jgi:hypothetical protein